jgi:hypothetical protein
VNIHNKLEHLIALADRPGTPEEGKLARQLAIELCLKYNLMCKFTKPTQLKSLDAIFYRWIRALAGYGWLIVTTEDTRIGRQIKFRKPDCNSEIRITQRAHSDGNDFEAEHIIQPDPDQYGHDWSYCIFLTISLGELLHHLTNR